MRLLRERGSRIKSTNQQINVVSNGDNSYTEKQIVLGNDIGKILPF